MDQPVETNASPIAPVPPIPTPPPSAGSINQASANGQPKKSSGKTAGAIFLLVVIVAIAWFVTQALMSARAVSRDAKRRVDVMLLQSGLSLYANDHNTYPEALSELTKPYKGQSYITIIPTAPTPPDGPCTAEQNNYTYKKVGTNSYEITYCIGRGGEARNILTGQITTIAPGVQTVKDTWQTLIDPNLAPTNTPVQ